MCADDLGGLAVRIAARSGALAEAEEIVVSGTLKDLVIGSGIEFEERGEHTLKDVSWDPEAVHRRILTRPTPFIREAGQGRVTPLGT